MTHALGTIAYGVLCPVLTDDYYAIHGTTQYKDRLTP
jgi:hypothetical protein